MCSCCWIFWQNFLRVPIEILTKSLLLTIIIIINKFTSYLIMSFVLLKRDVVVRTKSIIVINAVPSNKHLCSTNFSLCHAFVPKRFVFIGAHIKTPVIPAEGPNKYQSANRFHYHLPRSDVWISFATCPFLPRHPLLPDKWPTHRKVFLSQIHHTITNQCSVSFGYVPSWDVYFIGRRIPIRVQISDQHFLHSKKGSRFLSVFDMGGFLDLCFLFSWLHSVGVIETMKKNNVTLAPPEWANLLQQRSAREEMALLMVIDC